MSVLEASGDPSSLELTRKAAGSSRSEFGSLNLFSVEGRVLKWRPTAHALVYTLCAVFSP